jgi:hypothetical protein
MANDTKREPSGDWTLDLLRKCIDQHLLARSDHKVITMNNSQRIETATRTLVGKELSAKAIELAVKATFPGLQSGVYVSDAAFALDAKGNVVPRTTTQAGTNDMNDGVLLALSNGKYRVLATDKILRKDRTGRGRKGADPAATKKAAIDELAALGFKVE